MACAPQWHQASLASFNRESHGGNELIGTQGFRFRQSFAVSLVAILFAVGPLFADSAATGRRQVTKLADGVYAIQHQSSNDGNPSGNTTVIIGDREVFVVDSCYLPSLAREDIAQIRQWTNKPVGFLLNTHFHNDHNNGNKAYLDAFPSLAIVAQEQTKRDMDLIQPGNIERTPKQTAATIAALRQGKLPNGRALSEDEKKQVQELLPSLEQQEAEFKTMVYQPPTLVFSDKLDIDLGNREVQVKHLGRGNTPGDTIVYLPTGKNSGRGRSSRSSHSLYLRRLPGRMGANTAKHGAVRCGCHCSRSRTGACTTSSTYFR